MPGKGRTNEGGEGEDPAAVGSAVAAGHAAAVGHVDVLDGLRGFAIFLVVTFHLWQLSWLDIPAALHFPVSLEFIARAGFFGVEIFFFISGFCLFWPHARHVWEGEPLPTWREYAARRAAKILPSYYVCLLLVLLFFPHEYVAPGRLLWNVVTHLLFFHIWFYETYPSINSVTWSLAVEVQFYVLFPLVAASFRRKPWLAFLALAAVAQFWRLGVMQYGSADPFPYTVQQSQLPAFLDLFGGGMLAAWLVGDLRRQRARERGPEPWLCALAAVFALAAIVWLMHGVTQHPDSPLGLRDWQVRQRLPLSALLVVFTTTAALAAPGFRRAVANPFLRFLAAISYNLYLWHQVFHTWLFYGRIPAPATADPHQDPVWQWRFTLLALVVGLSVGILGTYLIERPFLRWFRRRSERKGE
jgi:Predicted acyltransferases